MSISPAGTPFDAIRREDEDGEYWSARDLMPLLGYRQWRRFEDAIDRAKLACANSGHDVAGNFAGAGKVAGRRGPAQDDYRLTRYACYLVAMNGDPRKAEIAAAQTYFAVKTRQAEVADAAADSASVPAERDQFDVMRALLVGQLATVDELARQARELRAVEGQVSQLDDRVAAIESSPNWCTSTGWAQKRKWTQTDITTLGKLGKRAAKIAREQGLQESKVLDINGRFEVHRWPLAIWDQAAVELGWIAP